MFCTKPLSARPDFMFEHFHLPIFAVESVVGERWKNASLRCRAGDLTPKLAQLILNDDLPGGIGINGSQHNEIWRSLFADLCS